MELDSSNQFVRWYWRFIAHLTAVHCLTGQKTMENEPESIRYVSKIPIHG